MPTLALHRKPCTGLLARTGRKAESSPNASDIAKQFGHAPVGEFVKGRQTMTRLVW